MTDIYISLCIYAGGVISMFILCSIPARQRTDYGRPMNIFKRFTPYRRELIEDLAMHIMDNPDKWSLSMKTLVYDGAGVTIRLDERGGIIYIDNDPASSRWKTYSSIDLTSREVEELRKMIPCPEAAVMRGILERAVL